MSNPLSGEVWKLPESVRSFQEFLETSREAVEAALQISERRAVRFEIASEDKLPVVAIDTDKLTPAVRKFVQLARRTRLFDLSVLIILAAVLKDGLKVFRPTDAECEVLEQVDPRFPIADYRQPYEGYVIELPADYRDSRDVENVGALTAEPRRHRPLAVLVAEYPLSGRLAVCSLFSSGQLLSTLIPTSQPDDLVCDAIERARGRALDGFAALSPVESEVQRKLCNLAVCTSAILTNCGYKVVDPNPAHRARLEGYVTKATKRGDPVDGRALAVKLLPRVMTIDQDVLLVKRPPADRIAGGEEARHVRPHWRRGHMRRQPYGEGGQQRKLVFIKPVLVNEGSFVGKKSDTKVTYRGRGNA